MTGSDRRPGTKGRRDERRLFIALPLDQAPPALSELSRDLGRFKQLVTVVQPDKYHLTLKFLGATDPDRCEKLTAAMGRLPIERLSLSCRLQGVGAFPSPSSPQVLWCGLIFGDNRPFELFRALEAMTSGLGFPAERRTFKPHLTIGRLRKTAVPGRDLVDWIKERNGMLLGDGIFTRLVLFESELLPGGPRYTPRAEIPLLSP